MVVLDMLRAKGPPMLIACALLVMWNTQLFHPIESHLMYVYFCQSYLRVTKNAHDGIASSLDMCKYSMCACPHNRDFLDGKDERSQKHYDLPLGLGWESDVKETWPNSANPKFLIRFHVMAPLRKANFRGAAIDLDAGEMFAAGFALLGYFHCLLLNDYPSSLATEQ